MELKNILNLQCKRKEGNPSFIFRNIMTAEYLQPIVEKIIAQTLPDAFLVSLKVNLSAKSSIQIFVDTDPGITIEQCSILSRAIGKYFDDENLIDFSYELEVSSPGLSNPLILPRQFRKNIGRELSVVQKNGEKKVGKLIDFQDNKIKLETEEKNPSTKKWETFQMEIDLNDIKEAIVQVFKKKEKK